MAGIVGTHLVAQVGFIVKDVEAAKKKWAEFLGLEVPPTQPIGAYETTQTVYQGQPAPEAYCWMAFFDVGPGLANYVAVWETGVVPTYFRNSLIVAVSVIALVEVLTGCPTNWGMSPVDALKYVEEQVIPYYPLGVYKDTDKEVR